MARPSKGRGGLDLESWLARKVRHGNLRTLAPYVANGGGIVHQPEPYARLLLGALRDSSDDPRASEHLLDDTRAFRSWVEADQIDLVPTRPTRHLRSLKPPAPRP